MMRKMMWVWLVVFLMVRAVGSQPVDTDGDGIPDAQEEVLGTDPGWADKPVLVSKEGLESEERRALATYDGSKDVLTVSHCHVAEDRFLWRVDMAEAPHPEDTVLHLYVDADADATTGRKGSEQAPSTGTEYMLSAIGGNGRCTAYDAEGNKLPGVVVNTCIVGNSFFISADVALTRTGGSASHAIYVLCHTMTSKEQPQPGMSDSTAKVKVTGIPLNDRKKIRRLTDFTEAFNTTGTYGLDHVRAVLKDPQNVVVQYDKLELDGFAVDIQTSRRYGHVVRQSSRPGIVSTPAPKGRYHVGFFMYDDGSDERVLFRVDNVVKGMAMADCNNYRHWIYWLDDAMTFKGGEKVELIGTGPSGKHGICAVLFMPTPPPIRPFPYILENVATYTPVGQDGTIIVSWTSQMPSETVFEYGATAAYGETIRKEKSILVHRARLTGLDPSKTYHGRPVGIRPDGSRYEGQDVILRPKAVTSPGTVAGKHKVPLTVRNPHSVAAKNWPVTSGIPFPVGVLGESEHVRMVSAGKEIPLQVDVMARWLDGSIKWLLLNFETDVPAGESAVYEVEYGAAVSRMQVDGSGLVSEGQNGFLLQAGDTRFSLNQAGELILPSGKACSTRIKGVNGKIAATGGGASSSTPALITVEENGPVRAVVKTSSEIAAKESGGPAYRIEKRVEVFRGSPFVRVQHTFTVQGTSRFSEIEEMRFTVPVQSATWQLGTLSGESLTLRDGDTRRQQVFDHEAWGSEGASSAAEMRLTGSASSDAAFVGLRHFWQTYPKAFERTGDGLAIDLCPDFEAGLYDAFPFEKEGHHLYYYLLDGHYKFPRGMAKNHELLFCFGTPEQRRDAELLLHRPLLATAPPQWYCGSRAFYDVAPRSPEQFKVYEEGIDANLKRYVGMRESQRDYGLMNFGDWYGERGANWGNIEYDTQHALLLEYIRSGNEDAFFLADETEIHNRDVDTIHWDPSPSHVGFVYIHQMGHVGGYYTKSVPGTLGIPSAGSTVSHAWAEGHFNHSFLTGDRRSYETGCAVADYFIQKTFSRPYDFSSCRVPGWHLMINAIAYASTCDPYYLNASRVIVDRVLEAQDPEPRPLPDYQCEEGRTYQQGGWSRMMVPGHCLCEPRHRGNAGFMVAILLSGLKYFHDVTGEEAVKQAIINGAYYLLDECYSPEVHGFRYTSCPKTGYRTGCSPLMAEGIARAYRWTGDPRFRDVLTEALPRGARGSGYGKGFSMYYRVAPRVLADLAEAGITMNEMPAPVRSPFVPPDWMKGDAAKGQIIIQAEDFTGQGKGTCQIRDDRSGCMGKIVTYWHQNEGHWLEWTVDIPENGKYYVRFHYATDSQETLRDFQVDGAYPCEEAKRIAFERTGGFGHDRRNWHWRQLTGTDRQEIPVAFSKGTHRIRMSNLKDGLGLDAIVLVPVK